ncbi:zf-CCCH domain-containing protein [Cephalotus follicularis]|uniref:Zf-CCCH domain-containing protein n=1 Tax=Cephalotus follicularis TaxID=3775 RepID=A0A1Q3BAQ2_CEPFO|nr:zf-CCCH domain-containing protein [Cephalotus follicularis]
MANQLYGYSSSYGGGGGGAATTAASSASAYSSGVSPYYHHLSSSYLASSDRLSTDLHRYSAAPATPTWPPGVDVPADPLSHIGIKRSSASEVLYHQSVFAHNTIGQSEAWYSTDYLAKRPRLEIASNLPIYPQRPGEKDCVHYMQTRTCKFGEGCKFDHPIWVPEGGIPDWKEVQVVTTPESLPQRPGEPDCPYFVKTQRCKFGLRCRFNHPRENLATLGASDNGDITALPERPSELPCAFYMKTGQCKFGATCKFHHPKDIQILLTRQENGSSGQTESMVNTVGITAAVQPVMSPVQFTPAQLHNSKGLPIRPGEVDCPFYLKTGSCKYGATCRYNHPDWNVINPVAAAIGHPVVASPAASLNIGLVNPAGSLYQTIDPRLAQPTLAVGPTVYPQRPGQMECDHYMKTGECKFGERCKFHHPIDRSAPTMSVVMQAQQQSVKLTLAGLPRREGAAHCPYYMKTGTCKYGATCKFDHPPPGEVMANAASQGTSTSISGIVKDEEKEVDTV